MESLLLIRQKDSDVLPSHGIRSNCLSPKNVLGKAENLPSFRTKAQRNMETCTNNYERTMSPMGKQTIEITILQGGITDLNRGTVGTYEIMILYIT